MEIIYEDCPWERLGSTFKDKRSREARQESVKLSVGVPGKHFQGQAEPGTRAGERKIVRGSVWEALSRTTGVGKRGKRV